MLLLRARRDFASCGAIHLPNDQLAPFAVTLSRFLVRNGTALLGASCAHARAWTARHHRHQPHCPSPHIKGACVPTGLWARCAAATNRVESRSCLFVQLIGARRRRACSTLAYESISSFPPAEPRPPLTVWRSHQPDPKSLHHQRSNLGRCTRVRVCQAHLLLT